MLYLVRKSVGSMGTTRAISPAARDATGSKVKPTPLVKAQPLAPSLRETGAPVMFLISMNSFAPLKALYINSLMTTGPTMGVALAALGVGEVRAVKSLPPVLFM